MRAEKLEQVRKRGFFGVVLAIVSGVMIVSPSYLADLLMSRLKVPVSIAAVIALAIFIVGVFLLIRLLKD